MANNAHALSTLPPTQRDYEQSSALESVLRSNDCYESHEEAILREDVLGRLDVLVKKWVRRVSREKVRFIVSDKISYR